MGIKTFVQEIKTKISASRFFKAMVVDSTEIVPKFTPSIKNIELVHGESFTPGCVIQTHFADGAHFKYMKVRVDDIDREKHTIKYTLFEGDMLGDKLEKISYELKAEDTEDGCVVTVASAYHTKGDYEIPDDVLKGAKEQAAGSYKACEEYLIANPNVTATGADGTLTALRRYRLGIPAYVEVVLPSELESTAEPPPLFDGTTKLYTYYLYPYAQRVWIVRNYKGLQDEIKLVPINLQNRPAWYKEIINPKNKVPALEHNGKIITESLDLVKYVDANFKGPSLLPDAKADNIPAGPVSYRMVKKMHYKNGVYTDGRSKRIIEEVEGMIARAKEPLPGTTQPRRVTAELENAFYAEVVKLDSRGRLFGHGCISQGLREISSSGVASRAEAPVSDPRETLSLY